MKKISTYLTLLALLARLISTAQIVDLNQNFSGCGTFTTTFSNNDPSFIRHTIIKPGGKILSAGSSNTYNTVIAQYLSNGIPDVGFGINGQAVISFNTRTLCEKVALQPDGKIIGVGTDAPDNSGSQHIPLIFRLKADGAPDSSFGVNGKNALRFDNVSSGSFTQVIVLSDGKILAAGDSRANANGGVAGPGIMKFNADGTPDDSFGNISGFPGKSRIALSYTGSINMLIQTDGKIILAYSRDVTGNGSPVNLELVRFLANGTIDNSFGTNGTLIAPGINMQSILTSAIQPDGKFLFSYTTNNAFSPATPTKIGVVKYLADFTEDISFGNGGKVELANLNGSGISFYSTGIGLQPDGKILLSGGTTSGYPNNSPMVIRLQSDGQLDAGFNNTGYYFTPAHNDGIPTLIDIVAVDNNTFIINSTSVFRLTSLTTNPQTLTNPVIYYLDADNDGYGTGTGVSLCSNPGAGYSTRAGDCNDISAAIHPGATEICGNGIDENCNGMADDPCSPADSDGDGIPDATDNCPIVINANQLDSDSDGQGDVCDTDDDNDGTPDVNDCAPFNGAIHPGAIEICGNGIDENCNGMADDICSTVDSDGDGIPDTVDNCPTVINANQLNTDSDGQGDACDTDDDNDGTPDANDCAPLDVAIHPGAIEICGNGIDENCNGQADEGCIATKIFRSKQTGNWNEVTTWEVSLDGRVNWTHAATIPTSLDGAITILTGHTVTVNDPVNVDEVTVDMGGILIQMANFNIADGPGDDLVINGAYYLNSGTINGNGNLQVNRLFRWESGKLQIPTVIGSTATLHNISTSTKFLASSLVNNGTVNLRSTTINFENANFINNGYFNTSSCRFLNLSGTNLFINTSSGVFSQFAPTNTAITVAFNNTGVIRGVGRLIFNRFINNGVISPGLHTGTLAIDVISNNGILSSNSELKIDLRNSSGIGSGWDNLRRTLGDIALAGRLTVTAHDYMPDGVYEIIRTNNGSIRGNFDNVKLPTGYSLQILNRTVLLIKNLAPKSTFNYNKPGLSKNNSENELSIKVMPNPASEYFNMVITNKREELHEMKIYDVAGKLIESKTRLIQGKTIRFGENLKSGNYVIEIFTATQRKVLKVIKIN